VPGLAGVLVNAPAKTIFICYLFGLLWGIGGLTFGLSMRYLGMSLGYALALGFCAAFGTIIPPIFRKEFIALTKIASGQVTLAGVAVCLAGIAICGWAGMLKEKELTEESKKKTIKEFNFFRGLWIAIFAGVMSACIVFGIDAGKPIASRAIEEGTLPLWQNSAVFVLVFAGGFTTNFIWCVFLNIKNRTGKNYLSSGQASLLSNYVFSALAGTTWYMQFMFYGMGRTKMGKYDFSSWTILMATIIVFSNIWGLIFREWKETSRRAHVIIFLGITVLIASTVIVGLGNYLASLGR